MTKLFIATYRDKILALNMEEAKKSFMEALESVIKENGTDNLLKDFVDIREVSKKEFDKIRVSGDES